MEGVKKKKKKKNNKSSPGEGGVDAEEDMISGLPDCLIHHILSFLKMEDVRRTSMLSKRWRYLWASVPVLDFHHSPPRLIDRCLVLYEGPKIRRFRVDLYDDVVRSSRIDSWIRFAMRRGVQELDMTHDGVREEDGTYSTYRLPPSLLDCGALRVLKLGYCVLDLPTASFCFPLLTDLHLSFVQLTDLDTSGCPLLQNLTIVECTNLGNIYAPSQKLRCLKMEECWEEFDKDSGLTLYAPYLQVLEYSGELRYNYNFMNLSSITSASLAVSDVGDCESDLLTLEELLNFLGHAKTLKLSELCLKLLSYREDKSKAPPLSATCLETTWKEFKLPGFALLLRSSHCLESLIINIDTCLYPRYQVFSHTFDEDKSWELLELALSADLQLKTVTLHNFMGSERIRESKPNMDNFIENSKEIRLVKLFLKGCKMLDKIIINTIKKPDLPPKLLLSLTKKLLALPRASPNAEIHFS